LPVCVFYLFKPIPVQACYKPIGFQEVEAPTFLDSRLMNVVKFVSPVHWLPWHTKLTLGPLHSQKDYVN